MEVFNTTANVHWPMLLEMKIEFSEKLDLFLKIWHESKDIERRSLFLFVCLLFFFGSSPEVFFLLVLNLRANKPLEHLGLTAKSSGFFQEATHLVERHIYSSRS